MPLRPQPKLLQSFGGVAKQQGNAGMLDAQVGPTTLLHTAATASVVRATPSATLGPAASCQACALLSGQHVVMAVSSTAGARH